jgi:choline dehydrogenase
MGLRQSPTCRASAPTCRIICKSACSTAITANEVINNWRYRYAAGLRYLTTRKGLLTIGAGYAGAFLRTRPELATPDVQFHFLIFSSDAAGAALHPFPGFMVSVCQLRPESRGFVRIKSSEPAAPPAIQPRYLSARADCDCVVDGMKLLRRVMNRPVMRRYIAEERAPGEKCQSDADLLAYARDTGTTVYHPTSTCRMGSDPNAVVDERLRVRGFERLRVDHADGGLRQYQRRRRDDRREGRGHGAAGRCGERAGGDFGVTAYLNAGITSLANQRS